jgi:hypothetical protein
LERYQGEFNAGVKEGKGTTYYVNGDVFTGSYLKVKGSVIFRARYTDMAFIK